MSKVTIPSIAVQTGGALQDWYYNNCTLRSDVVKTNDGATVIAVDNFILSITEVNQILNNDGEVEFYLMAVQANIAIMGLDVPSTLPNYRKLDELGALIPKQFSDWLVPGAEIWKKDDNSEVIFYTNPFAGNEDKYLKGSEIKIINDINPAQIDILKTSDAEVITGGGGWTKL